MQAISRGGMDLAKRAPFFNWIKKFRNYPTSLRSDILNAHSPGIWVRKSLEQSFNGSCFKTSSKRGFKFIHRYFAKREDRKGDSP